MMVHYGAPPDFRRGRDTSEIAERVEQMERAMVRGRRWSPLPFIPRDLSIPGLAEAMRKI